MTVRTRYAPSPTGLQHIGGVRTALFNYLFARANGGQFILRVEDTDRERSTPEALDDLFTTLEWMGIEYDEGPGKDGNYGPYIQSERQALYLEKAHELLSRGHAYPCFCKAERLDKLREEQKAAKANIGYDRHCSTLPADEVSSRIAAGESHVIRLKIPLSGKTDFQDILFGSISRKNADLSPDPVILKTDGFPTYHLSNVIDDHSMQISHILRAQEWIPSGPLHILIYRAFGWEPPAYCHLPMVMGKDGQKLSKRHGATAVTEFRKAGYLPEALTNYMALLGWSYDDSREFFTKDELCELFCLERINKSPAVFDYRKLEWFNGQYIRLKPPAVLKEEIRTALQEAELIAAPPTFKEQAILEGVFPIIRERLKTMNDAAPMLRFLFIDPGVGNIDDAIPKNMTSYETADILTIGMELLKSAPLLPLVDNIEETDRWDRQREEEFRAKADAMDLKIGALLQPLRMAVSASKISPPLFPSIRLLGIDETLKRAERLAGELKK